jgi:hypothetical protein
MPTFTIDTENNITVVASLKSFEGNGEGTDIFSSAEELAGLWPRFPNRFRFAVKRRERVRPRMAGSPD